jgi:hypothetical protein
MLGENARCQLFPMSILEKGLCRRFRVSMELVSKAIKVYTNRRVITIRKKCPKCNSDEGE